MSKTFPPAVLVLAAAACFIFGALYGARHPKTFEFHKAVKAAVQTAPAQTHSNAAETGFWSNQRRVDVPCRDVLERNKQNPPKPGSFESKYAGREICADGGGDIMTLDAYLKEPGH